MVVELIKRIVLHSKIMKSSLCVNQKLNAYIEAKGFTLPELLIGIAITGIVISIAGSGLVNLMQADQNSEFESRLRFNLNRALDFIADDARSSNFISTSRPTAWTRNPSADYTPVLYLTQPPTTSTGAVKYVAYYIGPSPSGWKGPKAIYRADREDFEGELLIDGIKSGGFTRSVTANNLVTLSLVGQACLPRTTSNVCDSPKFVTVDTRIFARATP